MFFLNRFASKSNSFLVFLVQENVSYLYIKVPGQEKKKPKKQIVSKFKVITKYFDFEFYHKK